MTTFVLYTRQGRRYFVRTLASAMAVEWLERFMGERVTNWDVAYDVPCGTTVLCPVC